MIKKTVFYCAIFSIVTVNANSADPVDELLSTYGDKCPQTINNITKPELDRLSSFQAILSAHKTDDKCFPQDDPALKNLEDKYNDLRDSHSDLFQSQEDIQVDHIKLKYLMSTLKAEQNKKLPDQDRISDLKEQIVEVQKDINEKSDLVSSLSIKHSAVNTLSKNFIGDVETFRNGALANLQGENQDNCAKPKLKLATSLISNSLTMASSFVGPQIGVALRAGSVLVESAGKAINDAIWNKRMRKVEDSRKVLAISCVSEVLTDQYCDMQAKADLISSFVENRDRFNHVSESEKLKSNLSTLSGIALEAGRISKLSEGKTEQLLVEFMTQTAIPSNKLLLKDLAEELKKIVEIENSPWRIYSYNSVQNKIKNIQYLISESADTVWSNQTVKAYCGASTPESLEDKLVQITSCLSSLLNSEEDGGSTLVSNIEGFLDRIISHEYGISNDNESRSQELSVHLSIKQLLAKIGLDDAMSKQSIDEIYSSIQNVVDLSRTHLNSFYDYQQNTIIKVLKDLYKNNDVNDSSKTMRTELCMRVLPFLNGNKIKRSIVKYCSDIELKSLHATLKPVKWMSFFSYQKIGQHLRKSSESERVCALKSFMEASRVIDQAAGI